MIQTRGPLWLAGLGCIFVVALGLRLHNLDQPLIDIMESRQTQTADIARNLMADSFNPFPPRVNRYGPDTPYVVLEFPLFNLIAALSARLTGFALEPVGRFWSGLFGVLGGWIWALYLKRHFPVRALFPGMIFYLFTFIGMITGRSFQPETLSLFWYLWVLLEVDACYAGTLFSAARRRLGILTALACLTKAPMVLLLLVPLAVLLWRRHRAGEIRVHQAISFLLVCFVPVFAWTVYGAWIHHQFPNPVTSNFGLGNWFKPELFFSTEDFNYYFNFWLQFRYAFLTGRSAALDAILGGILLVSMGSLFADPENRRRFLPVLISLGLYYFLFNFHTATHFYYHLPLLPLLAAGLTHWAARLSGAWFFSVLSAVITVALLNIHTAWNYMQDDDNARRLLECAAVVQRVVPENGLLLTSFNDQSGLQYYSRRVGWIFIMDREFHNRHFQITRGASPFTTDPVQAMREYQTAGAEYYANCDPRGLNRYPRFRKYLLENFAILYFDPQNLLIFKIKP